MGKDYDGHGFCNLIPRVSKGGRAVNGVFRVFLQE
jgi:hypothetical protein